MKLSVIIVSYNVEHFLAQCLISVERAIAHYSDQTPSNLSQIDVFVVDNISVDGTCNMVKERFPWVTLIENSENVGFSKANNQAIHISNAEYVLLLNPDTVIQEDTFLKCISFADENPKLGGMGVPMFDGSGTYLPESKRGIPTPWASLCRISGLFRLAPKSKHLNNYYAGHLSADENHRIDVLSGAFMWMRKSALDEVGVLDEAFFMYGEDIDLSWRIVKGGWENHYFTDTRIIHYKGESTKKGSLNYVSIFYKAMLIFAAKHFEGSQARSFNFLIRIAIYFRAFISVLRRIVTRMTWPFLEGVFLQIGLFLLLNFYANYSGIQYDTYATNVAMLIYSSVWVFFLWVCGGYDKPWIPRRVLKGIAVGSIVLVAGYGLLPEDYRFSRAILLLGAIWFSAVVIFGRVTFGGWRLGAKPKSRLIVAGKEESRSIKQLLASIELREGISEATHVITSNELNTIVDVVRVHSIGEIVFSGRDVRSKDIITVLASLVGKAVVCRIAWTDDGYVMGSGGPGPDAVTELDSAIYGPSARRSKRIFDLFSSLILLLVFPFLFVFKRSEWIAYSFKVFLGKATWVGLAGADKQSRPNIINAVENDDVRVRERLNLAYARKYNWFEDLKLVLNALLLPSVN
ncbi:MAG: glycosyltransferase family 2 protein [Flavobacteriales bacterium]|nr:glycosyltransferase family 2 protein [Flavobacteriales bacterium]